MSASASRSVSLDLGGNGSRVRSSRLDPWFIQGEKTRNHGLSQMIDDPGSVPGGVVDCLARDLQAFMKASDVGDTPLAWVAWFNNHRLLEPIGYIPPAEAESS